MCELAGGNFVRHPDSGGKSKSRGLCGVNGSVWPKRWMGDEDEFPGDWQWG